MRSAVATEETLYLDSVEVQVAPGGAGGNAGSRAAAHANPVGWAANLDNEHANVRILLVQVAVVYLAQAATATEVHQSFQTSEWDLDSVAHTLTCINHIRKASHGSRPHASANKGLLAQ